MRVSCNSCGSSMILFLFVSVARQVLSQQTMAIVLIESLAAFATQSPCTKSFLCRTDCYNAFNAAYGGDVVTNLNCNENNGCRPPYLDSYFCRTDLICQATSSLSFCIISGHCTSAKPDAVSEISLYTEYFHVPFASTGGSTATETISRGGVFTTTKIAVSKSTSSSIASNLNPNSAGKSSHKVHEYLPNHLTRRYSYECALGINSGGDNLRRRLCES